MWDLKYTILSSYEIGGKGGRTEDRECAREEYRVRVLLQQEFKEMNGYVFGVLV